MILCGEPDVLADGLQRTDDLQRFTSLRARLNPMEIEEELVEVEAVPVDNEGMQEPVSVEQKLTVETAPYIHPMIGMNDVSPYDFWMTKYIFPIRLSNRVFLIDVSSPNIWTFHILDEYKNIGNV